MLPYGKQTIEQDDIDAVVDVLKSDFLTTGPKVAEFEAALCQVTGASEAVVVGNGTHALHLACMAAGLGEGDFAIVPTLTFLATANAVRYCGADVIFCDVDADTGLIDLAALQALLEQHADKSIKAILPVHLAGQIVDLTAIKNLLNGREIKIIADACHAIGGHKGNYSVGSSTLEDMSCFSFHPVKTICMGEGGAITLNDADLANKMRTWRSHAMVKTPDIGAWAYEMSDLGYNYRATDFQCALGISQLQKLARFAQKRQQLVSLYNELFADLAPFVLPSKQLEGQEPAWHLFAARFDFDAIGKTRDQVMKALFDQGIGTQVHYIPVHAQPYYTNLYGEQSMLGAETYYHQTLSLPLYPLMDEADVRSVVAAIKAVCVNK